MSFLDEADVRRIVQEILERQGLVPREEGADSAAPLPGGQRSDQEAIGSEAGPCKADSQVEGQVQEGALWKHRMGAIYIVIGLASVKRDDGSWRPCVIYRSHIEGGEVFVRDLGNFLSRFTRVE